MEIGEARQHVSAQNNRRKKTLTWNIELAVLFDIDRSGLFVVAHKGHAGDVRIASMHANESTVVLLHYQELDVQVREPNLGALSLQPCVFFSWSSEASRLVP